MLLKGSREQQMPDRSETIRAIEDIENAIHKLELEEKEIDGSIRYFVLVLLGVALRLLAEEVAPDLLRECLGSGHGAVPR